MITLAQLCNIGSTIKPHGINGEISATIDNYIDVASLKCIIMKIDGIFVPFFISSMRPRGSESILITIDGVNNEIEAKQLCGKTIYGLKDECVIDDITEDEDGFYAEDLIGFNVVVDSGKQLGKISDVDTSTDNTLFIVTDAESGQQFYIPVADEFINEIDTDSNTILMSLPDGLLNL